MGDPDELEGPQRTVRAVMNGDVSLISSETGSAVVGR